MGKGQYHLLSQKQSMRPAGTHQLLLWLSAHSTNFSSQLCWVGKEQQGQALLGWEGTPAYYIESGEETVKDQRYAHMITLKGSQENVADSELLGHTLPGAPHLQVTKFDF